MSALSSGQPLPHQVLSSEAQQCRANRIAADQVRESKASSKLAKQKAAQAKPAPKKPVQPSANSVAARRLAAMRGQPLPEEQQHQQQYSEYSVQEGNAVGVDRFGSSADYCNDQHSQTQQHTFDPFADHPAVATATTAPYVSPSASTFAFSTAAAAAPPRASFAEDSQDSAAAFTPSSGAGAVEAFAAFNTSVPESSTFDPFAAPAVDVTANAAFKAFGATPTTSDGFSNFDSDETPSFYAFGAGVPSAASGFDAFQAPGLGADYDFAPTEVASVGGVKLSAGFDNFDAPVPTTTGFKTFSLSADNPFDSFEPTANSTNGTLK